MPADWRPECHFDTSKQGCQLGKNENLLINNISININKYYQQNKK